MTASLKKQYTTLSDDAAWYGTFWLSYSVIGQCCVYCFYA